MYAFLGDRYFLSNGYECPLIYEGIEYPSAEAAYNAQKSEDIEIRKQFCTMNWNQARDYGQEVKLREGWDDMRDEIMLNVIRAKFKNNRLRERLLMTRTEHLEEANDFGDTYWGTVDGKGLNKLGEILIMQGDVIKDKVPLVADKDIAKMSFINRFVANLKYFIFGGKK